MKKIISVTVLPKSRHTEIIQMEGDHFKVKLSAPPTDGKANEMLLEMLSDFFKIPKSSIQILRGLHGKNKIIEILF